MEDSKWHNGVIEAMFVDLSVTVRDIETKMVHSDIQRPQVNPVMAQGIDAYKKVSCILMSPFPHLIGSNPDLIRNELIEEGKEWMVTTSVNCHICPSTVTYISQLSHTSVNCQHSCMLSHLRRLFSLALFRTLTPWR